MEQSDWYIEILEACMIKVIKIVNNYHLYQSIFLLNQDCERIKEMKVRTIKTSFWVKNNLMIQF